MATTLPRPSRPSLGPPNAPLPSLPVPKTRKNSVSSIASVHAEPKQGYGGTTVPSVTSRAVSSSSLPTRPQPKSHAASTSSIPTVNAVGSANASTTSTPTATPGKGLRKTISIGSFPQPPKGIGRISTHPSSPLSHNTTSADAIPGPRKSLGAGTSSGAESTVAKRGLRTPTRGSSLRTPLSTTPSLLNGSDKSVASAGLLGVDLPESRNSSAQGSYATSATTFEEMGEDEPRGRDASHTKSSADRDSTQKDGKGNVIVSVRVRPDAGANDGKPVGEWMVDGRRSLISFKGREGGEYTYDNVFATHDNNARVYDAAAKRLVRRVMEGYHGTVFAYGMTGTGKTFSMQGTATSPGVIPLAITDIFSYIRETPHREFLLRVSYLEIYNEKIHDLLSGPITGPNGQPTQQEEIKLREDSKRGVYATPLKEEIVQSPTQLLRVIARGDGARRVAGTQYNARSSRSHAVVQIVVESRERVPGSESKRAPITPGGVRVSTLSLIDLAGSEKAAENKERRTEGAHINKSLLTLGTVIARLSGDTDKDGKPTKKEDHLPYRDSKLTRLLQPALQGNSLISILCTIQIGSAGSAATANSHTAETLNTLKFASRAKNNIVSHAKRAEEAVGGGADAGLLERYRKEIVDLRKQLEGQNAANAAKEEAKDEEEEKQREVEAQQRHEEQMLEMQLARTALKERIEHLNRLILSSKSIGVNAARPYTAMSLGQRGSTVSVLSNGDFDPTSARSSASQMTLEVPKRTISGGSSRSFGVPNGNIPEAGSEEDSLGDDGDGTASSAIQVRALQADLADKNRYIATLEKRLLQARRSSHSRVSMSLSQRMAGTEEGSVDTVLKEKDAEIAELKARLEDKERMVSALRSAARKRDVADLSVDTSTPPASAGRRSSSYHQSNGSHASNGSSNYGKLPTPVSPVALLSPGSPRTKGVEEMTKMLDALISEQSSHGGQPKALRRTSMRIVSETR